MTFRTALAVTAAALLGSMMTTTTHAADADPNKPGLEFAFEEHVTLAPAIPAGKTPYGERLIIPITGGTFEGPGIKGEIIPGGWDWQLRRSDGCTDIKADYMLRTDDGVIINVVNKGTLCGPDKDGKPRPGRTHPVFEAPLGKYEWLGQSAFIGTLEPVMDGGKVSAVRIRFYKAI
jgi:Bacterial lipocalin